ncbi:FliM/FliN family flagellar motor switch protein [Burkholderia sp. 22PA0099]|uniref:FliM/FliN family flagellar motor switch protein n=1 Tax=Burkholderia sp. 22PA0099 TaxID=3237372 RepID=UPI0039C2F57C
MSTHSSSARRSTDKRLPVVLDSCTLGRPFHLLDTFHQALQRRLARYLHARFNRRHGAALDVTGVSAVAAAAISDDAPWRAFVAARDAHGGLPGGTSGDDAGDGRIAVRIERGLLIALLAWHYGDQPAAASAGLPAETETEQRFGAALALALADEFAACVAPLAAPGCMPCPSALPARPARGAHVVRVNIVNRAHQPPVAHEAGTPDAMPKVPDTLDSAAGTDRSTDPDPVAKPAPSPPIAGAIEFALDDRWLARLFASVAPRRGPPAKAAAAGADTALESRIPIRVTARMLTRDVSLDDVMRLAPGDVMPVRLPDTADVLVEGVCLYRAVVAEHGGTLCLTAFEEME